MRRSRIWPLAALLVIAPEFSLAQSGQYTTPNTGVCWDMDSLVVHSGGIVTGSSPGYTFHGSVTISPLDTLMISAGKTLIFDDTGGDFYLAARGTLFAQGADSEPITFTSAHQVLGDWQGISILQGILEHCRVEYAWHGIVVGSSASVIHSTIMYNYMGLLPGGSAVIRDNLIANNQSVGILVDGGIVATGQFAMQCEPVIEDNEILDNGSYGIGMGWGSSATIRGNLIRGNDHGIDSGPLDCSIVVENTIVENNCGVVCDNHGFWSSSALNLGDLDNHSTEDDGGNHLYDNLQWDLYYATPDTIKAEGNHWGTTDLATINSHIYDDEEDVGDADGNGILSGPVDFLPIGETSVQPSTWGQIKARFR